jgi:hypothetical protein
MAQDNRPQSNGTATVTVASKMPNGLILRVFDMVETQEPLMGGGFHTVKVARERPERIVVNGNAHPQNKSPMCQIVAGYALTPGVSKELWDLWRKQNESSLLVKNGLIFAHENSRNTEAEAAEKKDIRSGLERLDPERLPKGIQRSDMMKAS